MGGRVGTQDAHGSSISVSAHDLRRSVLHNPAERRSPTGRTAERTWRNRPDHHAPIAGAGGRVASRVRLLQPGWHMNAGQEEQAAQPVEHRRNAEGSSSLTRACRFRDTCRRMLVLNFGNRRRSPWNARFLLAINKVFLIVWGLRFRQKDGPDDAGTWSLWRARQLGPSISPRFWLRPKSAAHSVLSARRLHGCALLVRFRSGRHGHGHSPATGIVETAGARPSSTRRVPGFSTQIGSLAVLRATLWAHVPGGMAAGLVRVDMDMLVRMTAPLRLRWSTQSEEET
jgi:hypothetical protein